MQYLCGFTILIMEQVKHIIYEIKSTIKDADSGFADCHVVAILPFGYG